uniref:BTB domain-containing protein n=1 Tax=Setaria digitata TaxID=48799 RepID=A0A915PJZ4_9BILA
MNDGTIEIDDVDQLDGEYWDKNLETDYTQQSNKRYFGLEVGDVTFYIDPNEMSKKSCYFQLLTSSDQFVEGIRGSGRLHDGTDEIACMLQSICPTVYGIYPRIIRVQSIPALARLADKYNLKTLQLSCEHFALRANFRKYGNDVLVKLLQTAMTYNYDSELRESLIKELLARSQFPISCRDSKLTREICGIIKKYSLKHCDKQIICGICHNCGRQKSVDHKNRNYYNLWKCERCDLVYCLECKYLPCMIEVYEQLRNAFENYKMEQLRKEAEIEMAKKGN